jgi:hypothetical protein
MDRPLEKNWWERHWRWFVPVSCLTLLLLGVIAILAIFGIVFGALKSSDAYTEAVALARQHPEVREVLGEPIEEGFFVQGSVNISGTSGDADLTVPLEGPKGKAKLYIVATRFAGTWEFERLVLRMTETGQSIDLLE